MLSTTPALPSIKGVVLFDRDSSFPKGKPSGVIRISEIKGKKHKEKLPDLPESIREDWQRLAAPARAQELREPTLATRQG